jgi:hypothetical protein
MTETPSDEDLKKLNAEHRRQRNMTFEEECRYCTHFAMQKDAKIKCPLVLIL